MEKSKLISQYQLFCLIFLSSIFSAMMYSSYTVQQTNLLMLSISAAVAAAALIVIAMPVISFINRSKNENIIRVIQARIPLLSGIFSSVYTIYFMFSAVVSLVVFALLLSNFINPGLPFTAFFLLTLVCCYYSANKGISSIGRASTIFFILIAISIVIIGFSLSFRINILNYSAIFAEQPIHISENTLYLVAYTSSLPSLLIFSNSLNVRVGKTVYLSIIISNIIIMLTALISFGVLGEYLHNTPYPFYTATQLIELGAFQRLDVIFLALWTVGMFVKVSMSLCALRITVQSTVHAAYAKILNPVLAVLTGAAALISVNSEALRNIILNKKIMIIFYLIVAAAIPTIVLMSMKRVRLYSRAVKTAALLMCVVVSASLLTGCQKTQIQDRMIIKGIGVDRENEIYKVTVQYIDNYADGSKQQNKSIQVTGKTVGDAMGKIKNSSGSEPFLGQNSAIIIGWDTAGENMREILDYFIRYSEARPTVRLYVSETTAEDILTLEVGGSLIPIDHMTNVSPSTSKNDNRFTILSYINQYENSTDTPTVSVLHIDENTIKLSSVAAIDRTGEIYKLDEDEFIVYKTMIGIENGTILCFDGVSGKVTGCEAKIDAKEKDGNLNFDVRCKLDLTILENPNNISDNEIEQLFDNRMHDISVKSVNKLLNEKNYDIFNFGRHLKFDSYKRYSDSEAYKESLKNSFSKIDIICKTVETTR